jgi:uncharacterized protein
MIVYRVDDSVVPLTDTESILVSGELLRPRGPRLLGEGQHSASAAVSGPSQWPHEVGRLLWENACRRAMETPAIDVAAKIASAIRGAAAEGVVSAYLFGSHAEGRAHRESDVDVGVLFDRRSSPGSRDRFEAGIRLSGQLQSALGTRRVDLVVLNDAPPGLSRHVVSRGQRLLCSDEEADHAFVRDVLLRAADLDPFLRRTRRLKLEALAR